jgi:hypothetical protein
MHGGNLKRIPKVFGYNSVFLSYCYMPHHLVACFPLLSCYLVILLTQILVVVTSYMDQRFGFVEGDQRKLQGHTAAGREWEISSISFHLHRDFFPFTLNVTVLSAKRGW